MSKKIRKFFDFEVRAAEGDQNSFWFTASTAGRDRMGDIIVQEGWRTQDFMKTGGPILWAHDYSKPPIGKGTEIKISPNALDIKVEFVPSDIDPFAGQIKSLVAGGFIRTGSVGFQVYRSEPLNSDDLKQRPEIKWGSRLYGDLLEFSIVPVPANPEALAQKEFSDALARSFHLKSDEVKSPLLPYEKDGKVNERLLRASVAALLGARGFQMPGGTDQRGCMNHLERVAKENGIELPVCSKSTLKEAFHDVWHAELLDIVTAAQCQGEEDSVLSLIKGGRRNQLVAARDAINSILDLSEIEQPAKPADANSDVIKGLINDLSSLSARLK